jgi:hypothetical protein
MRVKFALVTTEPITISPHVLRLTFWAFAARIGLTSLFDSDADITITECEFHPLRQLPVTPECVRLLVHRRQPMRAQYITCDRSPTYTARYQRFVQAATLQRV